MTNLCEVVVTAPDAEWLAAFTRGLIDDNLCAGAHEVERIRALYRWQGQVYDRAEARVAVHTRGELVPAIVQRANDQHPYEVPCVVATPIVAGNPQYLRWIEDETRQSTAKSAAQS